MRHCLLALGGNLGDVPQTFLQAIACMPQLGIVVDATSRLYQSAALTLPGTPPQPDYINAVVAVRTRLSPANLLQCTQALEAQAQRRPQGIWCARPLDIDILDISDLTGAQAHDPKDKSLQLPHPGLPYRPFVLWPLLDVAPQWRFWPSARTADDYLQLLARPADGMLAHALSWRAPRWQHVANLLR